MAKFRNKSSRYLILCCILVLSSSLIGFPVAKNEGSRKYPTFRLAPFNPDFIQCLLAKISGLSLGDGRTNNLASAIPSPIDTSHYDAVKDFRGITALPAYYDLRTKNKLTSVKNQGRCGSCWSFATFGSLESVLKPQASWDFSEQDLIEKHGFDFGECEGGGMLMSAAYLARWAGPIRESVKPYEYYHLNEIRPNTHVQTMYWMPDKMNPSDNARIKAAVMKYGAVIAGMHWDESSYRSSTASYFYGGNDNSGGLASQLPD